MTDVIGRTLGHCRVLALLGEGGMGQVYRAHDERLARDVAIKILPEAVATDPGRLARFEREARAIAALSHPNILAIYELAEHEGRPYMVTELLDGEPLDDRLRTEFMEWRTAVDIGAAVATGLAAAHANGIVHRDIKPSNLFLTADGKTKILDFGLARHGVARPAEDDTAAATATRHTEPGTVMGTIGYMSPEQVRGEPADHRSDIFSLGCVLYEMICGRRPFAGDSAADIQAAILREEPEELRAVGAPVPRELAQIIRRCLHKRPEERFQSSADLAFALRSVATGDEGARPPPTTTRRRGRWPWAAAALAAAASATVLSVVALRNRPTGMASPHAIESLAVLPLANLTGDPNQEYFVDGMTDALIANLAQLEALRVISRTSAMRYRNSDMPLPQIARELKVDGILEGSVARGGDRVRISAQLIDASSDRHVWAGTYERRIEDVLALQREVARAVATEIKVRVTDRERDRLLEANPLHPEAYDAYLLGRWYWNQWHEAAIRQAIDLFNRSIELDTGFAPAYAGLADSYVVLSFYSQTDPRDVMPLAKTAALKALSLDDTLAEAHASLGFVLTNYDFDWDGAQAAYRQAIELNPGSVTVHLLYMWYLIAMTRFDEALVEAELARELSPLDVYANRAFADALLFARRYDAAIAAYLEAIEMDPQFAFAHFNLGRTYLQVARYDEALAAFEEERRLARTPSSVVAGWIGITHAAMGQHEQARRVLNELTHRFEREYVPPALLASLHFSLGHDDEGFAWLDVAFERRDGWLASIKAEQQYDGIREDPRYLAFLDKMDLPP